MSSVLPFRGGVSERHIRPEAGQTLDVTPAGLSEMFGLSFRRSIGTDTFLTVLSMLR